MEIPCTLLKGGVDKEHVFLQGGTSGRLRESHVVLTFVVRNQRGGSVGRFKQHEKNSIVLLFFT